MRSSLGIATLRFALVCLAAGCASSTDPQDELAGDAAGAELLRGAGSPQSYFAITADLRKCASPLCGGWFLERVNHAITTCHDGSTAATCYAPVLDWSATGLSAGQQGALLDAARREAGSGDVYALVRGRFARTNTTSMPRAGRFVISEAWVAEGDAASDGVFVRVVDNGIRCFAAPCPSVTETVLNMSRSVDIAEVDFAPAGLNERQLMGCRQEMSSPGGILVVGHRYTVSDNGITAKARTATAVYERLSDVAP